MTRCVCPVRLSFILTPLNDFMTLTLGTTYALRPSYLAYYLVAFSIINEISKVNSDLAPFSISVIR